MQFMQHLVLDNFLGTNPGHSTFKEPNATATPFDWLVLTVHAKGSGLGLGKAATFGPNDNKGRL